MRFSAKLFDTINQAGLDLPNSYPKYWVVDVKSVGTGANALVYLGRYLYLGVIQEKDIIACDNGQVTFRHSDTAIVKPNESNTALFRDQNSFG